MKTYNNVFITDTITTTNKIKFYVAGDSKAHYSKLYYDKHYNAYFFSSRKKYYLRDFK